jgi:hypothetical protein
VPMPVSADMAQTMLKTMFSHDVACALVMACIILGLNKW